MDGCRYPYQYVLPDIFFEFSTLYLYITDEKKNKKSQCLFDNFTKIY